jgi:WD40 repeat protein
VGVVTVLILPVLLVVWLIQGAALREARRFEGHRGPVLSLAFAPDGKRFFSGGEDTTVREWDVETGKELRRFPADPKRREQHAHGVGALAVSPDGKWLLSSDNHRVRLWELAGGEQALALDMDPDTVTALTFTDEVAWALYVNTKTRKLNVWRLHLKGPQIKLEVMGGFEVLGEGIQNVALSPDARRGLTAGVDGVRLWRLSDRRLLHHLRGHEGMVFRAVFSPDGKQIATGGADETVRLWDADTGEETRALRGASSVVVALAFDREGRRLLSGASARRGPRFEKASPLADLRPLRLWEARTGRELAFFEGGPQGAVWAVAFSPDGRWALSGGEESVIRLWPLSR